MFPCELFFNVAPTYQRLKKLAVSKAQARKLKRDINFAIGIVRLLDSHVERLYTSFPVFKKSNNTSITPVFSCKSIKVAIDGQ